MTIAAARTATPIISYNGADQTAIVYPSLIDLDIKEGINTTGDAVQLRLADPEGKFRLTWTLKAVVPLDLTIKTQNWNYPGEMLTRDFGNFTVTRCDISQNKGSGTVVSLYASSINPCSPGRLQKKSAGFTATTLSKLAGTVAQSNKLTLHYLASVDPPLPRVDQSDQSDYVLLKRLCRQNDLYLKVTSSDLWIRSMADAEKQKPVGTIVCPTPGNVGGINGVGGIISWNLSDAVEDTYGSASVKYRDLGSGTTVKGTATDPTAEPGSPVHEDKNNPVTTPARAVSEGQVAGAKAGDVGWAGPDPNPAKKPPPGLSTSGNAVAKSKLKQKNRKRRKHSIVTPLNLTVESSTVFTLSGFALGFDGNWLLINTQHRLAGKGPSTTALDFQKCLDF
jgi:hypothetical protein